MALQLDLNSRDIDQGQFYVQPDEPKPHWLGWKYLARFTWWTRIKKDSGKSAVFFSLVLFGHFQTYWGTAKCDATRTFMARDGQLGEPRIIAPACVMTKAPSEMKAFRWRKSSSEIADKPDWMGMGSA
jgi:hypothetical protein